MVRWGIDRYRVTMQSNPVRIIHVLVSVLLALALIQGPVLAAPQNVDAKKKPAGNQGGNQGGFAKFGPQGPIRAGNPLQLKRAGALVPGFDLKKVAAVAVPSEVQRLVGQLAVDDFMLRTDATIKLRRNPAPDESLMAVLARGGLLEEQRVRLLGILEWRILNRSRGAVGVRMTTRPLGQEPEGIEISEVLPGLPAERVLKVGDVLQRLDGRRAVRNEDLILQVQQMRPGEKIVVDLLRPVGEPEPGEGGELVEGAGGRWYERVEVEIVLGSYEQLNEDPRQANAETRRRENYVALVRAQWGDPVDIVVIDPKGSAVDVGGSSAP